ncbi:YoaK family protein [Streptomyces sp. MJM1172]|uniref:YoaK family protein n=1 Tax=Streptomyces sp. MJM1172 TaxID=1703926 RepID=UPI0009A1C73E|nr:YoaK family protein [Streptomyces sp. MJM1172]
MILRRLSALLFPPGPDGSSGPHGVVAPLLIVLTFVSGLVDAVSYLGLDHVFVANMTGNVVFLGFALAGDRELSGAASVLALGAFIAGAMAAGRLRRDRPAARMFGPLVAVQAGLVGAAFAATSSGGGQLAVVGLLALGMGLQNAVVHRLAVPDLTTTVVTRALTGLAADPWGAPALRRLVSVVALLCGAFAGGLLTLHHGSRWALLTAVVLLAWVAVAGLRVGAGRKSG